MKNLTSFRVRHLEANADVADARTVTSGGRIRIQFNPTQPRERVRFSIAHEIAHTLFPDVGDAVRHRATPITRDAWQLEMLCNLAAAEFVMPIGSLPASDEVPPIEMLMIQKRQFDVSAEAFLIRIAKVSREPVLMFCASPPANQSEAKAYRIDYIVASPYARPVPFVGRTVPAGSAVYSCTAIGYTARKIEHWSSSGAITVECVGIPGYPGSSLPRVAGLIRSPGPIAREHLHFVHGDVLDPKGAGTKVICQLVNDQARRWGGGVAKSAAKKFPEAHHNFTSWISSLPRGERLGQVHFTQMKDSLFIASLVAQQGYGESLFPRIRYEALEHCFERIHEFSEHHSASVHMPRIGIGAAGGSWEIVEDIVRQTLVNSGTEVTVYDLPPKRMSTTAELFD